LASSTAKSKTASQQTSQSSSPSSVGSSSASSTSSAEAIGAGIGTAALIGIIVAVIFFIGLACAGAGAFICIRRSRRRRAAMAGNLIDMNPSHNVSGVSTAAMLPGQTQGTSTWSHSPQTQPATAWAQSPQSPVGGWENQAGEFYNPHYQQTPTGMQGQNLVELNTASSPQPSKERFFVAELP
jgi:hypothetical protein